MTLLVLGINHKTASVAVREKVAFSEEKRQLALQQIHQQDLAESAVILSTCNRTEIYLHHRQISPQECKQWQTNCINWFANIHQLSVDELNKSIYTHQNQQAANHLMRVACGLDSLILGEPQILGQVKQAFQISEDYYQAANIPLSSTLSRLFQKTFATAKRVRTETNIGESAVSVAYAACSLARQIFESLRELQILLVGAGETIELVSRHLLRHGVKKLMIANRTLSRAEQLIETLASNTPIEVYSLEELQTPLNQADIVISSTGSPNVLITKAMAEIAEKARQFKPTLMVDIAVPRDIDENVSELESVYHYTVDDLQDIIQRNLFTKLRIDNFQTKEQLEPMSRFKMKKLMVLMKNIADMPAGEVTLSNPLLNKRLKNIQKEEATATQVSKETIYLLRIIIANVNATMNHGIPVRGIIQLGQYLRSRGEKVDFMKLEQWLSKLHVSRLAQLQGNILINLLGFEKAELPFVKQPEKEAISLTLRSITNIEHDTEEWHFRQGNSVFVHNNQKLLRRNLRRSMRYIDYAPIETTSNFLLNFSRSLSEIEE